MPHQCTNCGFIFEDGDDAVLSGCSECGGQKFQFVPESSETNQQNPPVADHDTEEVGEEEPSGYVSEHSEQSDASREDSAQARARSESVDTALLTNPEPETGAEASDDTDSILEPVSDGKTDSEPVPVADLKNELEDQFGSIQIREPGKYSLNLMELFSTDECIITIEEDGRYRIESLGSVSPASNP